MNNISTIGFELGRPIDEILVRWSERREKLLSKANRTGYSKQHPRESIVNSSLGYAVLRHLASDELEGESSVRLGVTQAIEYFHTDWWKEDENDRIYMDRSSPETLLWCSVLRDGLFCACLLEDWEAAAKLASWFDDDLVADILSAGMADDLGGVLLSLASRLCSPHFFKAEPVDAAIRSSGGARSKKLLDCLEAIDRGDQETFAKALNSAIATFIKQDQADVPNVAFWVDIESSLVAAWGRREGMELPKLSPKRQAALVTRQSAEFK